MRFLLTLFFTVLLMWLAGFAWFLSQMMLPAADSALQSDVLIVLTGGGARVERGFELLADGSAPRLYISGVGRKVTKAQMFAEHTGPVTRSAIQARGGEIVFDYDASTTQTNAQNTAEFIRTNHYQRIRLITANYHMPRSLLEFHHALPEVEILPEPVVPEEFAQGPWWQNGKTRALVIQEYHKYIAAWVRMQL